MGGLGGGLGSFSGRFSPFVRSAGAASDAWLTKKWAGEWVALGGLVACVTDGLGKRVRFVGAFRKSVLGRALEDKPAPPYPTCCCFLF